MERGRSTESQAGAEGWMCCLWGQGDNKSVVPPQCSEPGTQSWPGNPPQFLPKKIAQKRLQRVNWEFLWKFQAALDKFSMHSSSLLPVPAHQSFPESSQERMRG